MFFVVVSRHPVIHVHVGTCLLSEEERSTTCTWVTGWRDTTTKNMSSFRERKIYNMYMGNRMSRVIDLSSSEGRHVLCCLSRHPVTHVHVVDLSSSEGRHVLCCCVSSSCFPCTCCRSLSSFWGRKIYNMYMGNRMTRHNNKEHVFLLRKKDLLRRKTCSLLLCLGIMLPMYML
jgi:hypothetical protein